jgi:hypothetical protein
MANSIQGSESSAKLVRVKSSLFMPRGPMWRQERSYLSVLVGLLSFLWPIPHSVSRPR